MRPIEITIYVPKLTLNKAAYHFYMTSHLLFYIVYFSNMYNSKTVIITFRVVYSASFTINYKYFFLDKNKQKICSNVFITLYLPSDPITI